MSLLEGALAERNLTIRPTPSDGNCFFWAVSDQLDMNGISFTHQELRNKLETFLQSLSQVNLHISTKNVHIL